ncbi:hypothetical protein [Paraburkholderia dilworthii]|uniref:hypothetical protein n=1 Tax=Paraburkholderia dilworthii TaxID=948106 RepID=UPI00040CDEB8|nr:hypothetical protein [Paraburkholderia dilworthii]
MKAWLPMLAGCASCTGALAAEGSFAGLEWRMDATTQAMQNTTRYGDALRAMNDASLNVEERLDIIGKCAVAWCRDANLVLKPRVRYFDDESSNVGLPQPKRFAWNEAYASGSVGNVGWLVGKRYLSWGPGMLYSPSNRLFPDNGNSTPRREIAGKTLGMVNLSLSPSLNVSGVLANPYLESVPGIDGRGTFGLLRSEYQTGGALPSTFGTVVAGGGAYRPYVGGYAQRLLGDAWTIGAEFSASYGYASQSGSAPALRENTHRAMADALVNLRYGLPSGGEIGIEAVYNGYRSSNVEQQVPALIAQPAGGIWQTRNRPLHPLPDGRYALVQLLTPSVFGNRRVGFVARSLSSFGPFGNQTFAEISYSPRDNLTAYVGVSKTFGSRDSDLVRTLDREIYVALELFM